MSGHKPVGNLVNKLFQSRIDEFLRILLEQKYYSPLTISNNRWQLNTLLIYLQSQSLFQWVEVKSIHIRQLSAKQ